MIKPIHAVGVIFEDESRRILILRRHADKPEGERWGLPGGKVEPGETTLNAALREAREETGHVIKPASIRFTKTFRERWDGRNVIFDVFKFTVMSGEVNVQLEQGAHTDYMWERPDKLLKRDDLMDGFDQLLRELYIDI